jgi:single-strand DNA-binding protein
VQIYKLLEYICISDFCGLILPYRKENMLKAFVSGRLGRDAEVRDAAGQKVISFSVAHSEKYRDKAGGQQEKTTWINCTWWKEAGKTAIAEYLKAGTQVLVEGTPSARAYEDKKTGKPAGSLELRVIHLDLMGGKSDKTHSDYPKESGLPTESDLMTHDDLPF